MLTAGATPPVTGRVNLAPAAVLCVTEPDNVPGLLVLAEVVEDGLERRLGATGGILLPAKTPNGEQYGKVPVAINRDRDIALVLNIFYLISKRRLSAACVPYVSAHSGRASCFMVQGGETFDIIL